MRTFVRKTSQRLISRGRLCLSETSTSMAHMMYSQHHLSAMGPPQKPETFMLSSEAQQSLPQDAQVALQQVDNRKANFLFPPS